MAYVPYGQNTVGGKQLAELMALLQKAAAKAETMGDWISGIGPTDIVDHPDFQVPTGQGSAVHDTALQIFNAFAVWYGDGTGGTNREKIARLARGE